MGTTTIKNQNNDFTGAQFDNYSKGVDNREAKIEKQTIFSFLKTKR
jgi:hypothetical protein